MKNIKLVPAYFLFLLSLSGFSQKKDYVMMGSDYFDSDSLKGFDEAAARSSAISEQFYGAEFNIRMSQLKRRFINSKYGLTSTMRKSEVFSPASSYKALSTVCDNEDFESSPPGTILSQNQINGWAFDGGYNGMISSSGSSTLLSYFPGGLTGATSCNLLGCCPMPPAHSEIVDCSSPGGFIDPYIGVQYPVFSVFGTGTVFGANAANPHISGGLFGSKVLRINDGLNADYSMERLTKSISVTTANALFEFAFIPVFSPGHACCDAGSLQITFKNITTNSVLTCPGYSISAPDIQCMSTSSLNFYNAGTGTTYTPGVNYGTIYQPWKLAAVDLSPYLGQTIVMEVIVTDCTAGGHFAFIYFDAACGDMKVSINENDYFLSDPVISYAGCNTQFTLTAPASLQSYQWSGPFGFTSTSASITTSVSGVYTLTVGQGLLCSPVTKTMSINSAQSLVSISSSNSVICAGNSVILTANNINNCVWNNGNSTPSIFVSPTITTNYTVTGTDVNGCNVSAVITQLVDACTGLQGLNTVSGLVSVYPNPNTGDFTIKTAANFTKGELIVETALGQLLHKQMLVNGENKVKIGNMVSGVYYYTITQGESIVAKGNFKVE